MSSPSERPPAAMANHAALSPEQHRAVTAPLGPVLVIAGAGSGKTRVLTHRAAHLLGNIGALASEIVALTFTNKAAREMRGRMAELVRGERPPFFGTFHGWALLLLRRHGRRLGLPQPFSVLAGREQVELLKRAAVSERISLPAPSASAVLRAISRLKMGLPVEEDGDIPLERLAGAYRRLARELGAVDFDDMILLVRDLLRDDQELAERLRADIRHVLVDEFQDTNQVQYEILRLLRPPSEPGGETSLFVVGDDDQSIYAFRGGDVGNILSFERDYPSAQVVALEKNYRSSTEILDAAAGIVRQNRGRRPKRLTAHRGARGPVEMVVHATDADEARYVAEAVESAVERGSVAVLYRTNAQSRAFEETLTARAIRYRMVGSLRFYERREVKDLLSYLTTVLNPRDHLAFARALSAPPRGVGEQSLKQLESFAGERQLDLRAAILPFLDATRLNERQRRGLEGFAQDLDAIATAGPGAAPMLEQTLRRTNFREWIEKEPQGAERLLNLDSLLSSAHDFDRELDEPDASAFLGYASLETGDDESEGEGDQADVSLLTLHAAKGLEWKTVILAGVEEGLIPHVSGSKSREDLEEERRLLYVGMTRAEDRLILTRSLTRRLYGRTQSAVPSRFLSDIPAGALKEQDLSPDQDPGVRFERALSFFGTRDDIPPEPQPTRPQPHRYGHAARRDAPPTPPPAPRRLEPERPGGPEKVAVPYGIGTRVRHDRYGVGYVIDREGHGDDVKLTITFLQGHGRKKMILKYAKLTIIP